MKLLRNLSGAQLVKVLESLADVAAHHAMTREALITKLFGK